MVMTKIFFFIIYIYLRFMGMRSRSETKLFVPAPAKHSEFCITHCFSL